MTKKEREPEPQPQSGGTCLYHLEHAPEGQVFHGAASVDEALADGWVDTPAKFHAEKPAAKAKAK